MQECWNRDKTARPPFEHISATLQDRLNELLQEDGVVPTRSSEIRAKKRKTKPQLADQRLDLDTRISTDADTSVKRFQSDVV